MTLKAVENAPSDFDFMIGDWQVKHRRLKHILSDNAEWVEFTGLSSTTKTLGGFGNVEDNLLNFPEGEFRAKAIRSFDANTKSWSIWWLDGRAPHAMDKPVVGKFENAIGTFYADDEFDGEPVKVRFTWNAQSPDSPKWQQAFSKDGGETWETNWYMTFSRVVGE